MLVLTRKQNEKIKIGENITITVLRMKGKGVRLGIQAPGDMNVLRGELVFDIEQATPSQDSNQNDPNLESKAAPLDSRAEKASRQFRNSVAWSKDTHPTIKREPAETLAENCLISWSI